MQRVMRRYRTPVTKTTSHESNTHDNTEMKHHSHTYVKTESVSARARRLGYEAQDVPVSGLSYRGLDQQHM
jgi:hypothetical protein